jgi:hypothetical protein
LTAMWLLAKDPTVPETNGDDLFMLESNDD